MSRPADARLFADLPGGALLSIPGAASAALIAANDFWLKRHHPGLLSGKLSDVGLCVFFPLLVGAALEWLAWTVSRARRRTDRDVAFGGVDLAACGIAAVYFTAIKVWPAATNAHVAWLSAVVPSWGFRAVTDPTDLVCLPLIGVAWWTMARRRARLAQGKTRSPMRIPRSSATP